MVVGPANFEHVRDIEQLGEALAAKLAVHPLNEDWQVPCPPHLAQTLNIGERLWLELQSLGSDRDPERVAEFMLQLFCTQESPAALELSLGSSPTAPLETNVSGGRKVASRI